MGLIYGWIAEMPQWEATAKQDFCIPMGSWKESSTYTFLLHSRNCEVVNAVLVRCLVVPDAERYSCELLRQNFFRLVSSHRPLLIAFGHEAENVDQWIAQSRDEIYLTRLRTYIRVSALASSSLGSRSLR